MDYLTEIQFRDLARAGTLPKDAGVRQTFTAAAKETGDRTIEFIVSTGAIDRHGTTINPQGWRLDHYRANPVVTWMHRADLLPVGRARDISVNGDQVRAVLEFIPSELSAFADQVYRLVRGGWLKAASVGFRPIKWKFSDDPQRRGEVDFLETELLEIAVVSVPSNPEALTGRRDTGAVEAELLAQLLELEALR